MTYRVVPAFLAVALVLTGCHTSQAAAPTTIRIGLIANLSGPFEAPGSELRDGFKLYLDMNGGKLGGHPIDLIFADEGYQREVAVASAAKLLEKDRVSAITGII